MFSSLLLQPRSHQQCAPDHSSLRKFLGVGQAGGVSGVRVTAVSWKSLPDCPRTYLSEDKFLEMECWERELSAGKAFELSHHLEVSCHQATEHR